MGDEDGGEGEGSEGAHDEAEHGAAHSEFRGVGGSAAEDVADGEDGNDDGDGCGDEDEGDQAEVSGGDGEAGAADGDDEAEACIVRGAGCRVSGWHGRRGGGAVGIFCHGDDEVWVFGAGCSNKKRPGRGESDRAFEIWNADQAVAVSETPAPVLPMCAMTTSAAWVGRTPEG